MRYPSVPASGLASTATIRSLRCSARTAPRQAVVVVLPTPPLSATIAILRLPWIGAAMRAMSWARCASLTLVRTRPPVRRETSSCPAGAPPAGRSAPRGASAGRPPGAPVGRFGPAVFPPAPPAAAPAARAAPFAPAPPVPAAPLAAAPVPGAPVPAAPLAAAPPAPVAPLAMAPAAPAAPLPVASAVPAAVAPLAAGPVAPGAPLAVPAGGDLAAAGSLALALAAVTAALVASSALAGARGAAGPVAPGGGLGPAAPAPAAGAVALPGAAAPGASPLAAVAGPPAGVAPGDLGASGRAGPGRRRPGLARSSRWRLLGLAARVELRPRPLPGWPGFPRAFRRLGAGCRATGGWGWRAAGLGLGQCVLRPAGLGPVLEPAGVAAPRLRSLRDGLGRRGGGGRRRLRLLLPGSGRGDLRFERLARGRLALALVPRLRRACRRGARRWAGPGRGASAAHGAAGSSARPGLGLGAEGWVSGDGREFDRVGVRGLGRLGCWSGVRAGGGSGGRGGRVGGRHGRLLRWRLGLLELILEPFESLRHVLDSLAAGTRLGVSRGLPVRRHDAIPCVVVAPPGRRRTGDGQTLLTTLPCASSLTQLDRAGAERPPARETRRARR